MEPFQAEVDRMWEKWLIPGVIPFTIGEKDLSLLRVENTPPHDEDERATREMARAEAKGPAG